MKKLVGIAIVVLATVAFGFSAKAGNIGTDRFGITGGFTSSTARVSKGKLIDFDASSVSLYHFGITYQMQLGSNFSLQPSLLYQTKGTTLEALQSGDKASLDLHVGFLELPVQLQWGPDLMLFRPYVFAEPFVGVGIDTDNDFTLLKTNVDGSKSFDDSCIKRFEYGVSFGLGFEYSFFQISAKYYWNLGKLADDNGKVSGDAIVDSVAGVVKSAFKENKNFNGLMVTAAIFF